MLLVSASPTLIGVIKNPATAPLFVARVVGSTGDGYGQLALAWGAMHLGHGPAGMSLVVACKAFPALLVLAGGVLGDRFRRHTVLAGAELLAASSWAALAVCFLTGQASLWVVCVLALLAGTARAVFMPAERGIVADLVTPQRRQAANALLNQSNAAGLLIGQASSGIVIAAAGPGWAAAIEAAASLIAALLLTRLRTPVWRADTSGTLKELRAGWREFTAYRWVWLLTLQFTAVLVAVVAFNAVIGPLYSEHGHGGSRAWGIITAVEAVGAFLGAVIAARWRSAHPVVACALLPATAAVPMLLMGLGVSWPVLAAVMLLPGICQTIYAVLWWTTIQHAFPSHVLARVNSWTVLGGFALTPAAALAAGPLTGVIGAQQAAAGAAVLIAAATVITLSALCLRGTAGPGAREVLDGQEVGARQAAPVGSNGARL
ncbi:MFS transporter [Actinomadura sp. B10D3]|uniref:MFS transporter n=1 Tax=Actinomadura sp. B10D3 TaxID=3153557 RepID=UPI00325C384C